MGKSTDKLLLGILLVFLVAAAANLVSTNRQAAEAAAGAFNDEVEQYNLFITEYLSTFENAVEMFSQNELVRQVSDNPEAYYDATLNLFKSFQESYPTTAFAYFFPVKPLSPDKILVSWPDTSKELLESGWIGQERPWYGSAVNANGKTAWTEPYIDTTSQEYAISVSKQVYDSNGNFIGVMTVDLYLNKMLEKIDAFKRFSEGELFILPGEKAEPLLVSKSEIAGSGADALAAPLIRELFRSVSGRLEPSAQGRNQYLYHTTNRLTDWKIVGVIDRDKLLQGSTASQNHLMLGIGLIGAIAIVGLFYTSFQMVSSLRSLNLSMTRTRPSTPPTLKTFNDGEPVWDEAEPSGINPLKPLYEAEFQRQALEALLKNPANPNLRLSEALEKAASVSNRLDPTRPDHLTARKELQALIDQLQKALPGQ